MSIAVLLFCAGTVVANPVACEPWCTHPCGELNGDKELECGACHTEMYQCRPGTDGYPSQIPRYIDLEQLDLNDLVTGESVPLSRFAGHALLVVNVASQCGFADESFPRLGELHRRYAARGLKILGVPADDFEQEPHGAAETRALAAQRGVEWRIFRKASVGGESAHPLFRALVGEAAPVAWNWEAFLLSHAGRLVRRWPAGGARRRAGLAHHPVLPGARRRHRLARGGRPPRPWRLLAARLVRRRRRD